MKANLLFLFLLAIIVVACGGSEDETPTPQSKPITLRFAVYDRDQRRLQRLIETFEENNPDVEIKLLAIENILDLNQQQRTWPDDAWVRLASAADVILAQPSHAAVEAGMVRDLAPLIEADEHTQLDDFYPHTLASCRGNGRIWCLPTVIEMELIYFDKDAFDEAGLSYPQPGWTWNDFLANASALTKREGEEVIQWGFVAHTPDHQRFIEAGVGPMVNTAVDPAVPRFDQPSVVDAVKWYTDLYLAQGVAPNLQLPEQRQALISERKVAMWPGLSFGWQWMREEQELNVGIVPFPEGGAVTGGNSDTTYLWAREVAAMSAGTAYPEAAWRWLDALGRQVHLLYGTRWLPARRSVAETNGFWDSLDEEAATTLQYALDHSYGFYWEAGQNQSTAVYMPFAEAVEAILKGEQSAPEALGDVQTQAVAAIEQEAAQRAAATAVPAIVVAPLEDEPQPAETAVTITFAPPSGVTAYRPGTYRELAETFQRDHPNIVIKLHESGGASTIEGMAAQTDCFSWLPQLSAPSSRDAVLSLEPFLEADPTLDLDDFYPALLEPFTRQGQRWGLPGEAKPYVLLYNKTLFDAAGLEYPSLEWTMDEFLETVVSLTQGEGDEKQYGFVPQVYETQEVILMMERLGANLVDTSVDPPTLSLATPQTAAALRWYASLSTEYGVKPVFITDLSQLMEKAPSAYANREVLIQNDRAAMWTVSESWELLQEEDNLGIATVPGGDGYSAGAYTYTAGYFISAAAEEAATRQACWQWMTYLSQQPQAAWLLPARRSVVASDAYRQQVGAQRAAAFAASVDHNGRSPGWQSANEPGWLSAMMPWLIGQAYGEVVEGQADAETALETAQQTFAAYRACIIERDAVFKMDEWQNCMREADSTLPDFLFRS